MSATTVPDKRWFVQRITSRFSASPLLRKITLLTGSTAAAQAISLLASPIISRLYLPEHFGQLALFSASFSILAVFATLRYEQAIPVEDSDAAAVRLLLLCFILAVTVALLTALALPVADIVFHHYSFWQQLRQAAWLLPIGLLLASAYNTLSMWAIRKGGIRRLAKTRLTQSASGTIATILLGLSGVCPFGLFLGMIVNQSAGVVSLFRSFQADLPSTRECPLPPTFGNLARKHYRFPLYAIPSNVVNLFSQQLLVVLLPFTYGAVTAGHFVLAQTLTAIPLNLVATSFSQVLYGEFAAVRQQRTELRRVFFKATVVLLSVAAACGLLLSTAPFWVTTLLGDRWSPTGPMVVALLPVLVTRLVASPLSALYNVLDRQRVLLGIESARLCVTLSALGMAVYLNLSPLSAVALYSIASAVTYVMHWCALLPRPLPTASQPD